MANNTINKTKGSAYSQPDHIKPKSKWTKKTTIWVIVIAVIVLGILAIIGAENGWFKTKDMINGKLELGDYSVLEVEESAVNVEDSTIDSYVNSIITAETTYEDVTEGTVEDGDTINLDYSGVLDGEEEPFDGGTATGASLTIGSGTMIDGFEEQIKGHEIGETFDIHVTFPEDYSTADLAGKDATFTITVNNKTIANVPDLTDELVQHYTEENFDEPISSVEELRTYYHDQLYNSYLESAVMSAMDEKANVVYYNEKDLENMTAYNRNVLSYYASGYGLDAESLAAMYGFENAQDYADSQAKSLLKQTMIIDKVAEDQGITVTDEEIDEVLTSHMETEGFTGTLDEFKAQSGDAYLFLIRETEVLMPKVVDYLKGNVTFVESPEPETESADAVEDAAQDAAEAVEEVADDAVEAVEEVVDDAAEAVEGVADDAVEAVEDAAKEAADTAENAVEDVKEAAQDEVQDAADAAEAVAEDVTNAVAEAANEVEQAAEDALEEVTSK